ncbi:hypothetical protein [Microbacterium hominis]|uniref:Uncharacterized protein n=1 Tax=Microbacterium hominis TaxID=162426 RepID=A0A7D4TRN4_9MICO|nr:hypothetical protein [Microbacterium hominis]QKJ20124.1 hypothetical protein HQM25_12660 [Microbacterium hominis]
MKKWIVRFGSLLAFNVIVLLLIGWLTPARVGWSALWAGILLTAIVVWIKPLVERWFRSMAAKSANRRTRAGEWLVEAFLTFSVALIVWVALVLLSGVSVGGGFFGSFWGWVLPPVILLIGWAVYAVIVDRLEAQASALYDKAAGGRVAGETDAAPAVPSPEADAGRRELHDGLTDEQRRMLDDLGKS